MPPMYMYSTGSETLLGELPRPFSATRGPKSCGMVPNHRIGYTPTIFFPPPRFPSPPSFSNVYWTLLNMSACFIYFPVPSRALHASCGCRDARVTPIAAASHLASHHHHPPLPTYRAQRLPNRAWKTRKRARRLSRAS